jgi:Fe2+ or Zn2+ uptake regulation protein
MYYENLLKQAGLKRTQQRLQLLELLAHEPAPVSVDALFAQVKGRQMGFTVSRSTLYRSLEQFADKGLVGKTTRPDSGKAYYELAVGRHRHFAVCLGCRKVEEIPEICPFPDRTILLGEFTVTGHLLQMYGYCKECEEKRKGQL